MFWTQIFATISGLTVVLAMPSPECKMFSSVYRPHETVCSMFYRCDFGRWIKFECGEGTVFNVLHNICDWPYNVNCPQPTTKASTWSVCEEHSRRPAEKPGCTQFYVCRNDTWVLYNCPRSYSFNGVSLNCESSAPCPKPTVTSVDLK